MFDSKKKFILGMLFSSAFFFCRPTQAQVQTLPQGATGAEAPSAAQGGSGNNSNVDTTPVSIGAGGSFDLMNDYNREDPMGNQKNSKTPSSKIPVEATEAQQRSLDIQNQLRENMDSAVEETPSAQNVPSAAGNEALNYWELQKIKRKAERQRTLLLKQEEGRNYQSPSF